MIAARVHPFPSRTRKLSSPALKILGWRRLFFCLYATQGLSRKRGLSLGSLKRSHAFPFGKLPEKGNWRGNATFSRPKTFLKKFEKRGCNFRRGVVLLLSRRERRQKPKELVLIAARVHPFPSRTRKLSSPALKILGWRRLLFAFLCKVTYRLFNRFFPSPIMAFSSVFYWFSLDLPCTMA